MKKTLLYMVLLGIVATGFIVRGDEDTKPLFMRDKKAAGNFYFYRSYLDRKTRVAKLVPEGVLLCKKSYGPGIYSVTFAVKEFHKKFQYHQQYFIFYFDAAIKNADELKHKMKEGVEYLYLVWRKSGKVEFYRHMKEGKKETLGIWIKPGPKKDNNYKKDTFVTMNVIVPESGGDLKVYFNKPPKGEADCEFTMPDHPARGMFGFYDPKWYSYIQVKDISYKTLN